MDSYFPPPVKEVEIPKKDGKVRKLGIPTISDRVAQIVIKEYLEPRFEQIFSPHSYGYRPGFFDNIDHEKLMLALREVVPYVHRAVATDTRANDNRRAGSEAWERYTTGRSDKPITGQPVSSLRHGQMVGANPLCGEVRALCR